MRRINGGLIASNADRRARCARHWMGLVSKFFDDAQDCFDLTASRVGFHYDQHVLFILSQIRKSTASPEREYLVPTSAKRGKPYAARGASADRMSALRVFTFSREH